MLSKFLKVATVLSVVSVMVVAGSGVGSLNLGQLGINAALKYNSWQYERQLVALHQQLDDSSFSSNSGYFDSVALAEVRLDPDTEHDSDCVCCC